MKKTFLCPTVIIITLLIILSGACAIKPPGFFPADIHSSENSSTEEIVAASVADQFSEAPPVLTQAEKEMLFIEELIGSMSLEEQIAQLFVLSLGADLSQRSDELARFIAESQAGGYLLFQSNITTIAGTKELTDAITEYSIISPFICLDEEGGAVSRLHSAGLAGYAAQPSAQRTGATEDAQNAYQAGETIGKALNSIGVNVDFAPVADVLSNPQNKVIGNRSYGKDPQLVSGMAVSFQAGLHSQGIMSAPKHFPGHGNTTGDSHLQAAIIASDPKHLNAIEYIPFIRTIEEGAQFIMVGHIMAPQAEPNGLLATLSPYFVTDILRGELRFTGIAITDAMNMGAITKNYSSAEAALAALTAGIDMILMPEDFIAAQEGIILAIQAGTISAERIHESLKRILCIKLKTGLISVPEIA